MPSANLDIIRGRQVVVPLTNRTGADSVIGDVVVLDAANDESYVTTTTVASTGIVGIVQESIVSLGTGRVLFAGYAQLVNVTASVTRGQFAETSATAKKAQSNATRHIGSFGQWTKGGTTPSAVLWGLADSMAGTPPTLTVEEADGTPTDGAVTKIVFPNSTLGIASHVATYTPAAPPPSLTIEEVDGTPTGSPTKLVFPNSTLAIAAGVATYTPPAGGSALTVEEVDGSPTDAAVTKIVFPNSTLGIAGHVATYTPAGGGGGGGGSSPSGALLFLQEQVASSSAQMDFTNFITSDYDEYVFEFVNIIPATNAVALRMRMSTDGGATYDSGANYRGAINRWHSGASGLLSASATSAIDIVAGDNIGSTTAQGGVTGRVTLYNPASAAYYKNVVGHLAHPDGTNAVQETQAIAGQYVSVSAVNAVRFLMSSGNITSGKIRVYGVAKTAAGSSSGGSSSVLLEKHAASASATLDFTSCISSDYDEYIIELVDILAGSASQLQMLVSTDGGSSYDTGASRYAWNQLVWSDSGSALGGSGGDTKMQVYPYSGRNCDTAIPFGGQLTFYNPGGAAAKKRLIGQFNGGDSVTSNPAQGIVWNGAYLQTTAVNAFRFKLASGNITSGEIRVYGVPKTVGSGGSSGGGALVYTNAIPTMTSATAPSGVASGSSFFTACDPWRAMTPGYNGWLTNGTATGWIEYDFGAAKVAVAYAFRAWYTDNFPSRTPSAWQFQGSNDDSTWITLDTVSGFGPASGSVDYAFNVSVPASFRYYRMLISANNGNAYTGLGRFVIYTQDLTFPSVLVVGVTTGSPTFGV